MSVKYSYFYGEFKSVVSKVYATATMRFPSGLRKCYKVWNPDRKVMEWIKADMCVNV